MVTIATRMHYLAKMASNGEVKKLKEKIRSIHTYSKSSGVTSQQQTRSSNSSIQQKHPSDPPQKRSKKEFHSYAKTWTENPKFEEASLPPDVEVDIEICEELEAESDHDEQSMIIDDLQLQQQLAESSGRPSRSRKLRQLRGAKFQSLPQPRNEHWSKAEKDWLKNMASSYGGRLTPSFWQKCANGLNAKFSTKRTINKCRNMYRRLQANIACEALMTLNPGEKSQGHSPSTGVCTPSTSTSCDSSSQLIFHGRLPSITTAASPTSHQVSLATNAPSHHAKHNVPANIGSGVPIIITPDGSSEDDPPPNISIEESHTLMQAVLSLSSTQIANIALQIPGIKMAIIKQLKDSGGARTDATRELADHSYDYHLPPS